MQINYVVDEFLAHRKHRNLAQSTIELYERLLNDWIEWRLLESYQSDIQTVSSQELQLFFTYLRKQHRPHARNSHRPAAKTVGMAINTIDTYYRIIRAFWRYCAVKRYITADQQNFFIDDSIPRPRQELTPRDTYSNEEIEKLLTAASFGENLEESWRDRAIILMFLESGMRSAELCSLTDHNTNIEKRRAQIRGKGGKWRWVYWDNEAARALEEYLKHRRGDKGGALFRGMNSRNDGHTLTPNAIRSLFRRLAAKAGIELIEGAPVHALRHKFAHRALDAGLPISNVAQLMGHSDIQTTLRYALEHPDELQKIHKRIFRQNS